MYLVTRPRFKAKETPKTKTMNKYKKDDDYTSRCRTCLNTGSLPLKNNEPLYLIDAIRAIADIEIDEYDEFPKVLCKSCFGLLQSAIQFKTTAQNADKLLRQIFKQEPLEDDPIFYENCSAEDFKIPKQDNAHDLKIDYEQGSAAELKFENEQSTDDADDLQTNHIPEISEPPINTDMIITKKSVRYPRNEKVECKVCKKAINKYYHKDHMALLHGIGTPKAKKKTECKICNKSLDKPYFKQHMSVVHGKEPSKFICYICGRAFKFESGYKSHIATHSDAFPYKCQHCPYRGRHSGLLRTHMRTHTRDYRYQCSECSAAFLTAGNLKKHMLKHKERDVKCNSCSRAFHSTTDLEKHFQADHLGIKNHICGVCGKAFGYRSAMMKHMLHVHKRAKKLNGRVPSYLMLEAEKIQDEGLN